MNGFITNRDHKAQLPEYREHARGRIACTVHVMLPGRRIVEARAVDISIGGLRLLVPTNLPLHSVCNIRLSLPVGADGVQTVMARAQVMNVMFSGKENGFMAGLRFMTIPRSAVEAIELYLQDRPKYGRHANANAGAGATRRAPAVNNAALVADLVC